MPISYTLNNNIYLDSTYTITNTDTVDLSLDVELSPDLNMPTVLYSNYRLTPGSSVHIKPTVFGIYKVTLKKNLEVFTDHFTYIEDIAGYFINDALDYLCGSDCDKCEEKKKALKNCNGSKEDCNPYYSLINQMFYLYRWYGTLDLSYSINLAMSLYYTQNVKELCNETIKQKILGENCCENVYTFKYVLLVVYYSFYSKLKKYIQTSNIEDKDGEIKKLDMKWKMNRFESCALNYGLTLERLALFFP